MNRFYNFFAILTSLTFLNVTTYGQPFYNQSQAFLRMNGVWCIPESIGFNFNDYNNFDFKSSCRGFQEGAASVSDPTTGQLLFYFSYIGSGYMGLLNKNHQVMLNGDSIIGSSSTTQGACIVPFVNDSSKYYLFTITSDYSNNPQGGALHYSVVDMNLDNGLGGIVDSMKNILLDSNLSEHMIAIPGDNCDIFLVVHALGSAIFKSYHISGSGLNSQAIISSTGNQINGMSSFTFGGGTFIDRAYHLGSMAISPNRKKLALTTMSPGNVYGGWSAAPLISGTLLSDFNSATGEISNSMLIDSFPGYGVVFSPDNSKLYLSSFGLPSLLSQFDLSSNDSSLIVNSKTVINQSIIVGSYLKQYNDTVYVSNESGGLARINSPNLLGISCDYQADAIISPFSSRHPALPNDVVLPMPPDTFASVAIDTQICSGWAAGISLSAMDTSGIAYQWYDHDSASQKVVYDAGIYYVKYSDGCDIYIDSFYIMGSELVEPQININVDTLGTALPYYSYQWMLDGSVLPGATRSTYVVQSNGNYQVIVTNEDGCVDTSDTYEVNNVGIQSLATIEDAIQIYPNPASNTITINSTIPIQVTITNTIGSRVMSIKEVDKAVQIPVEGIAPGVYFIFFFDIRGHLIKTYKQIIN